MNLGDLESKARRLEITLENFIRRLGETDPKVSKLFDELNLLWKEVESRTRLERFGKVSYPPKPAVAAPSPRLFKPRQQQPPSLRFSLNPY